MNFKFLMPQKVMVKKVEKMVILMRMSSMIGLIDLLLRLILEYTSRFSCFLFFGLLVLCYDFWYSGPC